MFVDSTVTPRFPDGFTEVDAAGQYREGTLIVRERTKLLIVVHPRSAASEEALAAVIAEYRRRFCQTSVGRVTAPVEARF